MTSDEVGGSASQVDVQPQTPKKTGYPKKLLVYVLSLLVAFAAVAGTVTVLAAEGLGKNKPWSKLAQLIPVEKFSLLDNFRKPNSSLVEDALIYAYDPDTIKKLGGMETKTHVKLEITAKQSLQMPRFSALMNIDYNLAAAANATQMTSHYNLSGEFSSGVFSFDTGKDGVQMDLIIPNKHEVYGKLNLSEKIVSTYESIMAVSREKVDRTEIEKYLDKFYLLNLNEYQAWAMDLANTGSGGVKPPLSDPQKASQLLEELTDKITPDFIKLKQNFMRNILRQSKVQLLKREKIAGNDSLVFTVNLDNKNLSESFLQAVTDYLALLKKYRSDLVKYCEAATPVRIYPPDCTEQIDTMFEEIERITSSSEETTQIRKSLERFFDIVSLEGLKVYVNPVDSTLLKAEIPVKVYLYKIQDELGKGAPEFEKFQMDITVEEVSRGKDIKVEAPKNARNLITELKNYMQEQKKKQEEILRDYPIRGRPL